VRTRNGKMVCAGAEACARDLGRKGNGTTGRVSAQTLSMSQLLREMEIGKVVCDRYSQ
jgi:hypothetical protein